MIFSSDRKKKEEVFEERAKNDRKRKKRQLNHVPTNLKLIPNAF